MKGRARGDAEPQGPMAMDPLLDEWRLPPSDRCWWCGAPATTMEHRIKHSTLRRVARDSQGVIDPANVFKKADDYEGYLRSLKKGTQVKWRKNMCANCNNARSRPFDLAYDRMESFVNEHADVMMTWPGLRWTSSVTPGSRARLIWGATSPSRSAACSQDSVYRSPTT